MGTCASPLNHAPLGAPSSSGIHTKLSIDASSDVNNMKVANPPNGSVPPAVVVRTPSLQAEVATVKEDKSTLRTHAYSKAEVIRPGAYSRSLSKGLKLDCAGCTAVHSIGIDHCHKHDSDKYGKGPHKRPRR